jgi:hypothetical protein
VVTTLGTFVLTWNPNRSWSAYDEDLERYRSGEDVKIPWSVGRSGRPIASDDSWFLLRQGDPRGIVAAGKFLGSPYIGPHWNGEHGKVTHYAEAL